MTIRTITTLAVYLAVGAAAVSCSVCAGQEQDDESAQVQLVARQVKAYNARDLEGFLATYAADAVLHDLAGDKILASGEADLRTRYTDRFTNSPDLHATIQKRLAQGAYVVDRESVVKKKGEPTADAVAIYRVTDERISHVWFLFLGPDAAKDAAERKQIIDTLTDAMNAHDVGKCMELYTKDTQFIVLPAGTVMTRSLGGLADRLARSFMFDAGMQVDVLETMVAGDFVIVHERITGSAKSPSEDIRVYEIKKGKITRTWVLQG